MSACWICCHTVWQWCSDVTLIRSLTLGTSLAQQCYVASHQMINFSTNHLFTELSARVASENLLKTLNVTSFRFRTQTLGLSWLAMTQLSFWQLSSAPSSHTLRFRQSWVGAELSQAPATLVLIRTRRLVLIGAGRLVLWWKLMILVWRRVIRIAYRCLRLSWHVIASWGWVVAWEIVTGPRMPWHEALGVLRVRICLHGCWWTNNHGTWVWCHGSDQCGSNCNLDSDMCLLCQTLFICNIHPWPLCCPLLLLLWQGIKWECFNLC